VTRLNVFLLLARAGKELSVGEIRRALRVKPSTLSHHLGLLRGAGLAGARREDRHIYYRARAALARELAELFAGVS
jgi:DNA-binding transcriptional ArsR family regulator